MKKCNKFISLFLLVVMIVGTLPAVNIMAADPYLPLLEDLSGDKPLKDVYKDYFLIGSIMSPNDLTVGKAEKYNLMKREFNVLTAENNMKPNSMWNNGSGSATFTTADNMVKQVKADGFAVVGHTLAWHSQSPNWLNNGLTYAEAKANLQKYISTVAGHYEQDAVKVIAWDVVNEAMRDNPSNPTNWRNALRQGGTASTDSKWFGAYANGGNGADYIYDAFLFAREAAPSATLYYNDYNDENANKATAIATMVKELNAKYAAEHPEANGRKLIEGIGMQGHYNTGINPNQVETSILKFIDCGVKISVTELDMTINGVAASGPTLAQEKTQAELYAKLFMLYKKYAAHIERITFWGVDDASSWRASGFPLPFNADYSPKETYKAILDPAAYLGIEEETNMPALKALIEQAKAINTTDWSDADLAAIASAITAGQALVDSASTNKTLIDEAIAALEAAMKAQPVARYGYVLRGTPALGNGVIDPLWNSVKGLPINRHLTMSNGPASGVGKVLWDDNNIYVLTTVTDPLLNDSNDNVHEKDSVEAFIDEGNLKTSDYQSGMGQYRVNYKNAQSFGSSTVSAGFESWTWTTETGYVVLMKIPFKAKTPVNGMEIGLDLQINDAGSANNRQDVVMWFDWSGNSWQNGTGWGVAMLTNNTELKALYDANKDKDSALYTTESWAAFSSALTKAADVLANNIAKQAEIDAAATALKAASKALKAEGQSISFTYDDTKKTLNVDAKIAVSDNIALTMYFALYSKDGTLIKVISEAGTASDSIAEFNSDLAIPSNVGDGAYVKAFFWDSATYAPICDAVSLQLMPGLH